MKRLPIFSTAAVMLITTMFIFGCGSSRGYYSQSAPPPRTSFSLIISPTPGFVMNRYPDGRYYHRTSRGFMYWKGYDNRFYLDRKYLGRVRYSQWEYNEWKRYNNGSYTRKRR